MPTWSEQEYQEALKRNPELGKDTPTPKAASTHRHAFAKARKVEFDGHTFDSGHEFRRYLDLKNELMEGTITDLEVHPLFILYDGWREGDTQFGVATYKPDFRYMRGDITYIEDVKSTRPGKRQARLFNIEKDAKLRMRIFIELYVKNADQLIFRVVDEDGYEWPLKWY